MIEIQGAWKRFGERTVLQPVTLDVRTGEVVALVGPNGAGKSTTLRILAGTLRPTGGRVTITDAIGYLPQRLGVPLGTVVGDLVDLVAGVRGVARADADRALAEAGLTGRLDATLGELSGGQRQRVMLACATLGRIGALLLDEPGISLDVEGAEEVRATIKAAKGRGAAVLFASHYLSDVAVLADRIVVMVSGAIVASGTLAELAAAAGVPWRAGAETVEAPIERIYQALVKRSRLSLSEAA